MDTQFENQQLYPKGLLFLYNKKLGLITNNIFQQFGISKTNTSSWDVYIPCGYNYVEDELKNISKISKNKTID